VGVSWNKKGQKWVANIRHDGKHIHLGLFNNEQDAAKAFDAKARELRGEQQAHGGRSSKWHWCRLNFPTAQEEAYAKEQGMSTHEEHTERDTKAAEQNYKSRFVGVNWHNQGRKWAANIRHDGKQIHLGSFHDEQDAAKAFDAKARELRGGRQAHGGRSANGRWWRLNFPTSQEEAYAKEQGVPTDQENAEQEAKAGETSNSDDDERTPADSQAADTNTSSDLGEDRDRKQDHTDLYCGASPGKRLKYRLEATADRQGGTVTTLLRKWPGWVRVKFDDGKRRDVALESETEGNRWSWEASVDDE
jgi:hypothetical protein